MLKDIFGSDIIPGDIILIWREHSTFPAKVISVDEQTRRVEVCSNSWDYFYVEVRQCFVCGDMIYQIDGIEDKLHQIQESEIKVLERRAEKEAARQKKASEKAVLKKNSKPGEIYEAHNSNFVYIGIDEEGKHVYCNFGRRYNRGEYQYNFMLEKKNFCQKMKSKKTPSKPFTQEIDVLAMFQRAKDDLVEESRRTNMYRYRNVEFTDIGTIQDAEALYKKNM